MPRARRRKGVPASAPGMRAAIYVRLSRETDETTSPERQRAACEALCEARGWNVIVAEEDIDVSGFSRGLDRPGLQRILTRLAELDVIVFFKIDRLARSTVDFAEIMRLAEHQSVALASATEPLDLTSSMGRAMAKVIAAPTPVDRPRRQRPGRIQVRPVTHGRSVAEAGTGLLETHVTGAQSAHPPALADSRWLRSELGFHRPNRNSRPL